VTRDEKRREEVRRDRHTDPAERWRLIQETITWAEAQSTVRRNTPAACKARERRLLAAHRQPRPARDVDTAGSRA
jgi:hypothetical protein